MRWLWLGAIAVALVVVIADAVHRTGDIREASATGTAQAGAPEVDPASPSGYKWNQHRLILSQIDGYAWLLEVEAAARGRTLRVRRVDYDNAPQGREVHWSGFMRWWTQALAATYREVRPGLDTPRAVERVAPWANAVLLAVFLIGFTPVVARTLGAIPAALLALGCVGAYPFYDLFRAGYLDHHGAAGLSSLATVILLAAGGAGWVQRDEAESRAEPASGWPPTERAARRCFLAAGFAASAGLWISAATVTWVLVGIGGAVLLSAASLRSDEGAPYTRIEPSLFRWWGAAGAAGSLCFYFLEYLPSSFGMRLEVNHPLYSLAFLGAGDLLARVLEPRRAVSEDGGRMGRAVPWLVADMILVLAPLAYILLRGASAFVPRDPFLWRYVTSYIAEFSDLRAVVAGMTPRQILVQFSPLPLLSLPAAALLWIGPSTRSSLLLWRAFLSVSAASGLTYAYLVAEGAGGNALAGMTGAIGACAVGFVIPLRARGRPLSPSMRSAVAIALAPAVLQSMMSFAQVRWLQSATAVWIGAVAVIAAAVLEAERLERRWVKRLVLVGCVAIPVLLVPPSIVAREPFLPDPLSLVTRDASSWLRRRVGSEGATILAGPTATMHMVWFGGFRGVGTLYWENLAGVRKAAAVYAAVDAGAARQSLAEMGVTHIAFYDWDQGLEHLASSWAESEGRSPGPGLLQIVESQLLAGREPALPSWLAPLSYVPPRIAGYTDPVVHIFEVVEEMSPEVAAARLARYYQATGDERMAATLERSLQLGPSVPGLAMAAQFARARRNQDEVARYVGALATLLERAEPVELVDRIDVAIAFGLTGDSNEVSRHLTAALVQADERQLRRLPPERLELLLDLSRQTGLDRRYPEVIALAEQLMAPA